MAEVRANPALAERIAHKFKIKNTTGYSLNALVDYSDPIDVLQHLMIGSEGTLGFIAEITYRTVVEHAHKASALVFFADVASACEAVALLKSEPVDAVEIMDRAALRSVQDQPGMPAELAALPEGAAALLIETRAGDAAGLGTQIAPYPGLAEISDHPRATSRLPMCRKNSNACGRSARACSPRWVRCASWERRSSSRTSPFRCRGSPRARSNCSSCLQNMVTTTPSSSVTHWRETCTS